MSRTYRIILLFLLQVSFSHAQTFAPIGATWHFTEKFAGDPNQHFFKLTAVSDTLIRGKKCSIIQKNKIQDCSNRPFTEYMYENDSSEVFFYDKHIGDFQMLWDFNPDVGDEWSILDGEQDTILTYHVDSIDQIVINGSLKKRIHATYIDHLHFYQRFNTIAFDTKIIESLGDQNYFFPWMHATCDINYVDGLRCYSDSAIGFFETGIASSCEFSTLEIADLNKDNLSIYPNPVDDVIYIDWNSEDDFQFNITDLTSKQVKTGSSFDHQSIDLKGIKSGIYFIQILDQDKNRATFRFIKSE